MYLLTFYLDDGFQDAGAVYILTLAICGDNIVHSGEECDHGNFLNGDGCNENCQIEPYYGCSLSQNHNSVCAAICGDGIVLGTNKCDDGNIVNGDGCDQDCQVEPDFECSGQPSDCIYSPEGETNDAHIRNAVIAALLSGCCFVGAVTLLALLGYRYTKKNHSFSPPISDIGISVLQDIKVGPVIGKGSFGEVYSGTWEHTPVGKFNSFGLPLFHN